MGVIKLRYKGLFKYSLLSICFLCATYSVSSKNVPQKTLLLLGDSLSAAYNIPLDKSWPSLLQQRLKKDAQLKNTTLINASISGDTAGNGLKRLPKLLQKHQPAVVIIELGGNDGLRGFQLKRLKQDLEKMIQLSIKSQAKVVLVGMKIPPNFGPVFTQKFHNVYVELAKQYPLEFVKFMLEDIGGKKELMQADGIHPTASAQPKILDNMWPAIKKALDNS